MPTKRELSNFYYVFSRGFLITIVLSVIMAGCGVVKKGAVEAKIEKEAVKIEKEAVKGEVKNNQIEVSPHLVAAFKSEINEIIAKNISQMSQTNNSGILSGGAPYLLAVIFGLLAVIRHIAATNAHKRLSDTKCQLQKQNELIQTLAREKNKRIEDIEYKAKISAIRESNGE